MPKNTLRLSVATAGMATLALAMAAQASAQERYARTHTAHTHYTRDHYAHPRYRHYARYSEGRQIVVHPAQPAPAYGWGPVGAAGAVVGGAGEAVQGVFNGAGAIVGGVLGGVFGGLSTLFGYPYNPAPAPSYAYGYAPGYNNGYGAPFAAPFYAAGTVAAAPFQLVSGALGGSPVGNYSVASGYTPATEAPAYRSEGAVPPQPAWAGRCDIVAGNRVCYR